MSLPVIQPSERIKGRGATINPANPFEHTHREVDPRTHFQDWDQKDFTTQYIPTIAKTIINKVESPDVGLEYSLNPYQGCEHGCIYCYARNTHNYWGYSSGLDFEQKIMVKTNAATLLDKQLSSAKWIARPIMMSGNTDCYQPVEKEYGITRSLLEVFWKHKHPVGIVTKNALILRDLDILQNLAQHGLVNVAISLNTTDDKMRQRLEPRASSVHTRLTLIKKLSEAGIPVTVLAAPIIPGLNDSEIFRLVKKSAEAGARDIHHIVVRLNGNNQVLFDHWLDEHYTDRKEKVLNQIKSLHGGALGSSQFGQRMKGEGVVADMIHQQFKIAKKLYMMSCQPATYNTELYSHYKVRQGVLF